MKVLFTGCSGFIGWKTCEFLLKDGHEIVGIDNLNTAYDRRLKDWRLSQLKGNKSFTFYRLDIVRAKDIDRVFKRHKFEAVINLAARAGVRPSIEIPQVYYETNVTGTLNLLEACRRYNIKKFILASTSSIYADSPRPFKEDVAANNPLSPYAASKKAAETLCYAYHYLHGLDITVLRYFTVYGPAGRPDLSIFRFIKWMAEDKPIQIFGDGMQERDYTYVDDIARGTILGLQNLGYQIINLGSDHPIKIKEVIKLLEKFLHKQAKIEHLKRHPADVLATWADINKAYSILKWKPEVSFEDGIKKTLDWYLENKDWLRKVKI
jgi:nucleoside-diphosphate-sugar epimerase